MLSRLFRWAVHLALFVAIAFGQSTRPVNMTWTLSPSTVQSQTISTATSPSGPFTLLATLAPTANAFTDPAEPVGATITYQLTALEPCPANSTSTNPCGSASTVATIAIPPTIDPIATICFSSPGAPSISFVQVNYAAPQGSNTQVNVPYKNAQAAGDLNVIAVGWNDGTATVKSIQDTEGNIYTRVAGPTIQGKLATQSIYYAKNIKAAAAGANTLSVVFSQPAVSPDIRILEYAGADPNNPVDVTAAAMGTSQPASSGSATTTSPNDLIFGASLVQGTVTGPGSGFTSRVITSPDGDIAEDKSVTTVGSYSATAPVSGGPSWIMQMVAFRN
jgi:hypothetical protein